MKITSVLSFAALAMAAPSEPEGSGAVAKGDIHPLDKNQEFSLLNGSDEGEISTQAYCGGFSHAGCSNACWWLGTRCWMCTATTCNCNNWSC